MITNPRELIADVGRWAESQPWHPKHAPDYGVVEELGELSHGLLKHLQGIKGFDNVDKFREHTLDCLGDVMVFLSHWCFLMGAYYIPTPIEKVRVPERMEMRDALSQCLGCAAQLLSFGNRADQQEAIHVSLASRLTQTLQIIAKMFGWDLLRDCLYPTWHRVRLRNFNLDKVRGGRDAIEAELGAPDAAPKLEDTPHNVNPEDIEGEKPIGA